MLPLGVIAALVVTLVCLLRLVLIFIFYSIAEGSEGKTTGSIGMTIWFSWSR